MGSVPDKTFKRKLKRMKERRAKQQKTAESNGDESSMALAAPESALSDHLNGRSSIYCCSQF